MRDGIGLMQFVVCILLLWRVMIAQKSKMVNIAHTLPLYICLFPLSVLLKNLTQASYRPQLSQVCFLWLGLRCNSLDTQMVLLRMWNLYEVIDRSTRIREVAHRHGMALQLGLRDMTKLLSKVQNLGEKSNVGEPGKKQRCKCTHHFSNYYV